MIMIYPGDLVIWIQKSNLVMKLLDFCQIPDQNEGTFLIEPAKYICLSPKNWSVR